MGITVGRIANFNPALEMQSRKE